MLNQTQKEKLKANWGEKASSMACRAEVKFHDPASSWACYVYAMNPSDENEISCIIKGFDLEVCEWRISEIERMFNVNGEHPIIDMEYRPRLACELFKLLSEGKL